MEVVNFKEIKGVKIGVFREFEKFPEVVFGLSTRWGGVSLPPYNNMNLSIKSGDKKANIDENHHRFFAALNVPIANIARPLQTHSNHVKIISAPGVYEDTDALITTKEDLFLLISFADCTPVFLYEPLAGVIASVHSGWRGTKKRIVQKTLEKMFKTFDAKPENIIAGMGPSIGGCCYEIQEDVAIHFDDSYLTKTGNRHWHLNLWKAVEDQLKAFGVVKIENPKLCTKCNPDLFFSYRMGGTNTGGMNGIIGKIGAYGDMN